MEPSSTNRKPWPYCGQLTRPMAWVVVMYSPRGEAVSGSQWTGQDSATWGTEAAAATAAAAGTTSTFYQEGRILSRRTSTVALQRDFASRSHRRGHKRTACGLKPKDSDIRRQTRRAAETGPCTDTPPLCNRRHQSVCLLCLLLLLQHLLCLHRA